MDDQLERLVRVAEEQLAWTRAMAMPTVKKTIESTLGTGVERQAYELSDGTRTTRDIAAEAGVSSKTISNWWRKWRTMGIATDAGGGRGQHLAPLADLGISLGTPDSDQ